MVPLPAPNQRHPWLRYQVEGYTEGIIHSYEQRLETIWSRLVNQVHVLDFEGLTPDEAGFGSEVEDGVYWKGEAEMGLDVVDTLCFPLGGAGFGAYWDGSDRLIPDKGDLRDYWIEISSDRDFLGPAPSYVLIQDPLHSMDRGTANVPHLLAQYLFRHAEGRKSGARLSGGHFIGRLAMHYGLVNDEGLRGLQAATAGAHEADEAGSAVDEGAQEILAPAQAPPLPPPAP
ncbi:hypothetical protein Tco_0977793 [Tanacetum coccineum]|uniref:Uncharacterized protein n=1 Tax=Tanacetum coccineum TaxID=301880 RepID=A0ABQ5EL38_9ASTR